MRINLDKACGALAPLIILLVTDQNTDSLGKGGRWLKGDYDAERQLSSRCSVPQCSSHGSCGDGSCGDGTVMTARYSKAVPALDRILA